MSLRVNRHSLLMADAEDELEDRPDEMDVIHERPSSGLSGRFSLVSNESGRHGHGHGHGLGFLNGRRNGDQTPMMDMETEREVDPLYAAQRKSFFTTTQTGCSLGKVRWLQDGSHPMLPDPLAVEYCVSSSCGERSSTVALWRIDVEQGENGDLVSKLGSVDTVSCPSNVTDITAVSDEIFALITAGGSLTVYKCPRNEDESFNRIEHISTKDLHRLRSGPCHARALDTNGSQIVTVGEDGSIFENTVDNEIVTHFEKADPLSIYCVKYVGRSQILTGNGGGQLKLWDLRNPNPDGKPMQTMNPNVVSNTIFGAISIAVHPSQKHLVIVGYQSGSMDLFDLRAGSGSDPIANLASKEGCISELYFHQINPDQFFSCSQTGNVCQWYPGLGDTNPGPLNFTFDLNIEFLKRGLVFREIYSSPFPVNSLNISKHDRLIAGGDSGILFCTEVSAAAS